MVDMRKVYGAGRLNRNGHQSPTAAIKVGNTDPTPLRLLQEVFGGKVYREPELLRSTRNKPVYTYRAYENRSSVILEKLLPYLRTKRPHAEIALRIYRLKATLSPKEFLLTPELFELVKQLRLLNNTRHIRNLQPIRPKTLPLLSAHDARTIAAYLTRADVRLVDRNKAAGLKWFRIRDLSPQPLKRLRAAFGGNVVRKGHAYYYSTTLEKAGRIAKRVNSEKLSALLDIAS
ncbi:MAG: hypothetical protein ACRD88_07280 [Terriglobia bacterium]